MGSEYIWNSSRSMEEVIENLTNLKGLNWHFKTAVINDNMSNLKITRIGMLRPKIPTYQYPCLICTIEKKGTGCIITAIEKTQIINIVGVVLIVIMTLFASIMFISNINSLTLGTVLAPLIIVTLYPFTYTMSYIYRKSRRSHLNLINMASDSQFSIKF